MIKPEKPFSLKTVSGLGTCLTLLIVLASCTQISISLEEKDGGPTENIDLGHIPDATPKKEEWARYGNHSPYFEHGQEYEVLESNADFSQEGIASWYGTKFHGELTSTREEYDMYAMTAAHKTLPLPSYVLVTNLENQKQVLVRVNDRGPFKEGRIIDLSYAAAHRIDMHEQGTAKVHIQTLAPFLEKPEPDSPVKSKVVLSKLDYPKNKINYLQVGVFSNQETANKLQLSLIRHVNNNVSVINQALGSARLFKVRIGPIRDFEELQLIQDALIQQNLPHFYLISE